MTTINDIRSAAIEAQGCGRAVVEVDVVNLLAALDAIDAALAKTVPSAKRNDYPSEFEEVWALYPTERQGAKRAAFKGWAANVKRGVEPAEILLGLRRYLAHAEAIGTETRYLKLAATFFGPDEHFAANYVMPARAQPTLGKAGQATARAAQDWMDGR
jgi:hypothetical protein